MPKLIPVPPRTKFGKWTILKYLGGGFYVCKCDCGTERKVNVSSLRLGKTRSCGCAKEYPKGLAARNSVLRMYRRGAKKRNLIWNISDSEFFDMTSKDCYYCGAIPKQELRIREATGSYFYNGLDRLDNSIGYVSSNIVPCCGRCNRAKQTMSKEVFLDWIAQVYNHCVTKAVHSETSVLSECIPDQISAPQQTYL